MHSTTLAFPLARTPLAQSKRWLTGAALSIAALSSSAVAPSAYAATCTPFDATAPSYLGAYIHEMAPAVGGLNLAAVLVENVERELVGTNDGRAAWKNASAEAKDRFVASLAMKGEALRKAMAKNLASSWKTTLLPTCPGLQPDEPLPSIGPVADYIALEKETLEKVIGFASKSFPLWAAIPRSEQEKSERQVADIADVLPPFPFSFKQKFRFNAMAFTWVVMGEDSSAASWLTRTKPVVSEQLPDSFYRSATRARLTREVVDIVRVMGRDLTPKDKAELLATIRSDTADLMAILVEKP